MADGKQRSMAKSRALLTETEREQISGEHGRERRYQAVSRVRSRINEELPEDARVLEKNHIELYAELVAALCGRYKCPRCGEQFDYPWTAFQHAMQSLDPVHEDIETNEIPDYWPVPKDWPDGYDVAESLGEGEK